ncbi:hypothetical protein N9E34_01560, partial [Opitutales bacterium]|nr:hypothetical protein [Opitutales bacterium]
MVKNEPDKPACFEKSFLWLETARMINSPEELLLELFRLIFFKVDRPETNASELIPDNQDLYAGNQFSSKENFVLRAFRGRKKKQGSGEHFYAAPYPVYAKCSWLRKKDPAVIKSFFLGGAFAQHVFRPETEKIKRKFKEEYLPAVINSFLGETSQTADFFSLASGKLDDISEDEARSKEEAVAQFYHIASAGSNKARDMTTPPDPLSAKIHEDFGNLCELSGELARYNWIQLLSAFLGIGTCSWVLSQMRLTTYYNQWLKEVISNESMGDLNAEFIERKFKERHQALFIASKKASPILFQHVEEYMKSRVELIILLQELGEQGVIAQDDTKAIKSSPKEIEDFLQGACSRAVSIQSEISRKYDGWTFNQFLSREAEKWPAYLDPQKKGQGRNILELLRVLFKPQTGGTNESYLLVPEKQKEIRNKLWYKVSPGPITLQLALVLTWKRKGNSSQAGRANLGDLISFFEDYGIHYHNSDTGIEMLKH